MVNHASAPPWRAHIEDPDAYLDALEHVEESMDTLAVTAGNDNETTAAVDIHPYSVLGFGPASDQILPDRADLPGDPPALSALRQHFSVFESTFSVLPCSEEIEVQGNRTPLRHQVAVQPDSDPTLAPCPLPDAAAQTLGPQTYTVGDDVIVIEVDEMPSLDNAAEFLPDEVDSMQPLMTDSDDEIEDKSVTGGLAS